MLRPPLALLVAVLAACASPAAPTAIPESTSSSHARGAAPGSTLAWVQISYGMPHSKNQIAVLDPVTHAIVQKFDLNFGHASAVAGPALDHLYVPLGQPESNAIVRIDAVVDDIFSDTDIDLSEDVSNYLHRIPHIIALLRDATNVTDADFEGVEEELLKGAVV